MILVPRPGTEHASPVLEAWNLNPWIAREDPQDHTLIAILRQHGTPETKQILKFSFSFHTKSNSFFIFIPTNTFDVFVRKTALLQKDLNVNPAKLVLIRSMDAVTVKAVRYLELSILPSLYYSKKTQTHFTISNIKSMPMNYFHLFFPMKINKKSKKNS